MGMRIAPRAGACAVCGKPLTDEQSIKLGIGPVCRNKGDKGELLRDGYEIEETSNVLPKEWELKLFTVRHRSAHMVCGVSKYDVGNGGEVVVLTEIRKNPGPSVTNSAAEIMHVLQGEEPKKNYLFIEHYPQLKVLKVGRPASIAHPETFSLVTVVDGLATWTHLSVEEVKIMLNI